MYHRTNHANGTRTIQTLPNGCMFETAGASHIGLLPSMMVMNGDGDDDTKASIFGKAVSHSCHVCLVSSLTVSFLSSPHVDPHEPLHERGPRCMSTTNYARARMQPVLPTVLGSATNMAFLQPCEKSTRSQSMHAHVKRQV